MIIRSFSIVWTLLLAFLLSLTFVANAAESDAEIERLGQRLRAIDVDPQRNIFAAYERLQARQALQALQAAKRRQRPQALEVAKIRVESAEIAARAESGDVELRRLELERSELLVEASRRDAERARAEGERLRVAAQIQAEEAARLRNVVAAESREREEVEGLLDTVAGSEAEKLRLARQREAELARREAELLSDGAVKPKRESEPE
jgi:hypothetical protein